MGGSWHVMFVFLGKLPCQCPFSNPRTRHGCGEKERRWGEVFRGVSNRHVIVPTKTIITRYVQSSGVVGGVYIACDVCVFG